MQRPAHSTHGSEIVWPRRELECRQKLEGVRISGHESHQIAGEVAGRSSQTGFRASDLVCVFIAPLGNFGLLLGNLRSFWISILGYIGANDPNHRSVLEVLCTHPTPGRRVRDSVSD